MKESIGKFLKSRLRLYLTFGFMYMLWWKAVSFEFAVILCLGCIIGEIHYQYDNPKK